MRPFRQGSLDGLCGVYAVVNSLQLIEAPLTRAQLKEIYHQLIYSLGATVLLESTRQGMEALTLWQATELTFGWVASNYGVALTVNLPFETRRFRTGRGYLRALREHVEAPATAAIIAFKNIGTAHWTVVRAIDGSTLSLCDSDGLRSLQTDEFAIDDGRRHFRPVDTIVIELVG